MISSQLIEEAKNLLVESYAPLEIYLFGSYAWGSPGEDSDLDILIVVENTAKDKYKLLVQGHKALAGLRIAKDILVYTKDEFDQYSEDATSFCYKIKKEGKRVHAKA